jgi:hypothetical protein
MKHTCLFALLSILLAIPLGASGCVRVNTGDKAQPLVSDAMLSTGVDVSNRPVSPSNSFYVTDETIYLTLKLNNAPAGTQVLARLTYISGEDTSRANSVLYSNTQTGQGSQGLAFAMKAPPGGFPQGSYQLAITANGKDQVSIPMTVQNLTAQKGWPQITRLTASPENIALGQTTTLSWDVVNATRVTLQPEVGTVQASGTRSLSPTLTTVYKIIASNESGQSTREVTVNVGAAVSGAPDLVITDVFLQECMIYYRIKNIGAVESPATYTQLMVDNLVPPLGSTSFVDVLKPGEERGASFSSYQWPWCGSTPEGSGVAGTYVPGGAAHGFGGGFTIGSPAIGVVDWSLLNHPVKVCADSKANVASEGNKGNNCLMKFMGQMIDYNLLPLAHLASWKNSAGEVPPFGIESSPLGGFIKMGDGSLEMIPDQVPQGWIMGIWGAFGTDRETRTPVTAAVKIPARLHFKGTVGLAPNATGSDGVTLKFGLLDLSGTVNWIASKKVTTPGVYEDWDVNLSDYEGQKVLFLLKAEAGPSPVNDFAVWKQGRVLQIND